MRTLHTYTVVPSLPPRLMPLRDLAFNLRWSWHQNTIRLFRRVDNALWESTGHNPARMLGLVAQERLELLAQDEAFLAQLDAVYEDYLLYLHAETWWQRTYAHEFGDDFRIAYFSAEFGITECLPIYSGGLGVLAGDHLKSASDLGIPLVGVGFLYQNGYFRQSLNADGWQQEHYPPTDFYSLPIVPTYGGTGLNEKGGGKVKIVVNFPGRRVAVQVWKARVGRVSLFLMDTNLPENDDTDRHIAGNLYGGDEETRIQQEIILGVGGIHALSAMGIRPTVCHMNEGHSAFLALERVRRLRQTERLNFHDAVAASASGNLFTTHTPVPAGFDKFSPELMKKYFNSYADELGITFEDLLNRGRVKNSGEDRFNMAVLAFRHARDINGVSKLHGEVSRKMAHPSYADFPLDEVPIGSVTNGIHTRSFLSGEMSDVLDEHLGEATAEHLCDPAFWAKVENIPDDVLWRVRNVRREKLVAWARRHVLDGLAKRRASEREREQAQSLLDPNILTVGFARRFATYKRGDLLLRDAERIKRILGDPDRPVQFVFAGKAHPKDDGGKDLIRRIVHFARQTQVMGRIVFLEDYDMAMARYLVQGVDVWLNNPRRPMEASGTSGMKTIANGGLNFSILDGWWAEGYDPTVGWAIGRGEEYDDPMYQDHVEAQDIYEILERDIAPLFYKRDESGIPHEWLMKVRASMKKLAPYFNTARMVREYTEQYYVPAARRTYRMAEDDFASARALVQWKRRVRDNWGQVRIISVRAENDKLAVSEPVRVQATVQLGAALYPTDVQVQLYTGPVDANRDLMQTQKIVMETVGVSGGGRYDYTAVLPSHVSGQHGFTVRVLPLHTDAVLPQELPLIAWESA